MTAYEKGFRRALEGYIDSQLYVLMLGYRNGHDAAVGWLERENLARLRTQAGRVYEAEESLAVRAHG